MKPRFRLRLVPLLVTVGLAAGLPVAAAFLAALFSSPLHLMPLDMEPLPWLYLQHGFQLLLGLLAMMIVKRHVPADYGLHDPPGKTYVLPAVAWGLGFGVLMALVDHAPDLLHHTTPVLGYELTRGNVAHWLIFEGIVVGPTEEIPFRALLVTYLATTMPGLWRIGGYWIEPAGIIVAILFALLHASSFTTEPWPLALAQQVSAAALGVLYAYWLRRSRSVLAPIIGHNVGSLTEYGVLFLWVGFSG